MNLNETEFLRRLQDINGRLYTSYMRLIMPRSPDHPVSLEEWSEFRETVGKCQREMGPLLELVEAGPLDSLLALFTELIETLEQYTKQGTSPFMTAVGRTIEKEEEKPSEQP